MTVINKIDTHHHIIPDIYRAMINETGGDKSGWGIPQWNEEYDLQIMDRWGIKKGIFSVSAPGVCIYTDKMKARKAARAINEYQKTLSDKYPDRFVSLGSLPSLLDVEGCLTEIDYAVNHLGVIGFTVFTSYASETPFNGRTVQYLGADIFEPIWKKFNDYKLFIFVHPCPGEAKPISDIMVSCAADFTFETTRTALHLVSSGYKTKYPDIIISLAHAGGTLPMIHDRAALCMAMVDKNTTAEQYEAAFKTFYFDTALSSSKSSLKALFAFADPTHVFYGSDIPWAGESITDSNTKSLQKVLLDEWEDKEEGKKLYDMVCYKNAAALFESRGW